MTIHTAVAGGGVPALPADPACCDVGVGVAAIVVVGVAALVVAVAGVSAALVGLRVPTLVVGGVPALVGVGVLALAVVGVEVGDSLLLSMPPKHTDLSTSAAQDNKTGNKQN